MRKRVLVVDDVPDWRATLQAILAGEFEVQTVSNYQEAMEIIRRREADLVIVDLRLSPNDEDDRQGMELLKELADHRINSIVLTGYPERDLQEEAEEKYKAFDFIDKSTLGHNFQRIRDVVREAFRIWERKEQEKKQAIRDASASRPVSFPEDLSSWPLRKYKKAK